MLKIRLMRIGAKKRPFYRVIIVDERNKRNGAYIESVGTYNPLTNPKEIKLNQERIDHWLKMGAQKSDGFLKILKEAPQKPPRKPKKGGGEEPRPKDDQPLAEAAAPAEVKTEESTKAPTEGTSSETAAQEEKAPEAETPNESPTEATSETETVETPAEEKKEEQS